MIDLLTGKLCYCSTGHPHPAVYHGTDQTVEFLELGGIPVRATMEYEFREHSTHLSPGDKLVLYTDGLSEARHDSELFGSDGICRTLEEYGRLAPEDLVDQLLEAATTWAGGRLADDTAILIVERET